MVASPSEEPIARIPFEACPLCGDDDAEEVEVGNARLHALYSPELPPEIHWIRCDGCGHVFTDGYFGPKGLDVIFRGVHASQTPGDHTIGHARGIAAKIVEDVAPFKSRLGGKWLDVGFGDGALLTTADELGYEVTGLDLRADSVAKMRAFGYEAHAVDLVSFAPSTTFDVISMADVLEHMPFPKEALVKAHALLAPGGLLFVSMPNMDAFAWRELTAKGKNPYFYEIEHVHNFGRKRLVALLEEHGFLPCRYGISQRYVACMEIVAKRM